MNNNYCIPTDVTECKLTQGHYILYILTHTNCLERVNSPKNWLISLSAPNKGVYISSVGNNKRSEIKFRTNQTKGKKKIKFLTPNTLKALYPHHRHILQTHSIRKLFSTLGRFTLYILLLLLLFLSTDGRLPLLLFNYTSVVVATSCANLCKGTRWNWWSYESRYGLEQVLKAATTLFLLQRV